MRITLVSILVDDQDKALKFYTDTLGLVVKDDVDLGQLRWLTVASPEDPDGTQIVLERTDFPPAQVYQKARAAAGIPLAALHSSDIEADYARLSAAGVKFQGPPQNLGAIHSAVFDDTCGNLIHLMQPVG